MRSTHKLVDELQWVKWNTNFIQRGGFYCKFETSQIIRVVKHQHRLDFIFCLFYYDALFVTCFSSFFRLRKPREQPVGRADSYDKTTFEIVLVLSIQENNVECTNKWMSQKEGDLLEVRTQPQPTNHSFVLKETFFWLSRLKPKFPSNSKHKIIAWIAKIMFGKNYEPMLIWKIIKYSNNNY